MEYFRNKVVNVVVIFAASFFVGAQWPRTEIDRQAWGFPFVYKWVMKPEFTFPEQINSHFSLFFLALNVLLLFLAGIMTWFLVSWAIWFIRQITYKISA